MVNNDLAPSALAAPHANTAGVVQPCAYPVDPLFGVRVATVPVAYMDDMRWSRTWTLVDEALALTSRLAREGGELAEALHGVIGADLPAGVKPALVGLRRDLFAGRVPRDRTWSPTLADALPIPLAARVSAWMRDHSELRDLREGISGSLERESAEKLSVLREAVSTPQFREALQQSSLPLSYRLDQWLASERGTPPSRKVQQRLAKYVARAAMKTSPFATFMASGLGRWNAQAEGRCANELEVVPVWEVERSVAHMVWHGIAQRAEFRANTRLWVNPVTSSNGGTVWFLGPWPREPINSVGETPAIRALLETLRARPGMTWASVRALLVGEAALPEDLVRGDEALAALVAGGLLQQRTPFSDQSANPLPDLIDWLVEHGVARTEGHAAMVAALSAVSDMTGRSTTVPDRPRGRPAGDTQTWADAIAGGLGLQPGRLTSRNLLVQSAVLPAAEVSLPAGPFRRMRHSLDAVRRLTAVFEPGLPVKIAATDFFLTEYGADAAVAFLDFYRHIHTSDVGPSATALRVLKALLQGSSGAVRSDDGRTGENVLPKLPALRRLRRETWTSLASAQAKAGGEGEIPPSLVDEITRTWPAWIRAADVVSCYGQLAGRARDPQLVVNSLHSGPRRGIGRIQHLLGTAADNPATAHRSELAEFRTDSRTSLNLRPATVRTLDYSHSSGDGGTGTEGLSPADLLVTYDPDRELVVLRDTDGKIVRPLHLGLVSEAHLPRAQSFLVRAFGSAPTLLSQAWLQRGGLRLPEKSAVTHLPRITIGSVVIARAVWRARACDFPVFGRGDDNGGYLLRVTDWLDSHGVPRRFFARIVDPDGGKNGVREKGRKPLYVDVTNWFLLQDLIHCVKHVGTLLVLEEVLPATDQAPRYGSGARRHTTEYVFDIFSGQDTADIS